MPRRVDARWGRLGMVRIDGFGKIDDRKKKNDHGDLNEERLREQFNQDRGRQGFLFNDLQFESLIRGLDLSDFPLRRAQLRADLDFIREFVLKGFLQDAQKPTRPEIHKAHAETARRLRVFLDEIADLGPLPAWSLADTGVVDGQGPLSVFVVLPSKLRFTSEIARFKAKTNEEANTSLRAAAEAADHLADLLVTLDFVSQDEIHKQLPQANDYHVNCLNDVVRIVQRLACAIDQALAKGKKRGGPAHNGGLEQAVIWLGDLFESYGGKFTHNPYDKTRYDGRPHSAAGKFVLKFLRTCDSTITEQAVSQYMAKAIRFRKKGRNGQKGSRETSS